MSSPRRNRRRRRSRSRLGFLFKVLFILTALAALTMGTTVFFQVEKIEVNGNQKYTLEEVVAASGIQLGDNLFRMNKGQISAQIRYQLPYIEGANIRRNLPNTIVINVNELGPAARIATPPPIQPRVEEDEEKDEAEDDQKGEQEKSPPQVATESWLISPRGKLLEVAPPDSKVMVVSGITPLDPEAGTMLKVPEAETYKREALFKLLGALEELGWTGRASELAFYPSRMDLRYDGRFTVLMPMDGDLGYKLNVLEEVIKKTTEKHGETATGTIDLTRKDYDAGYLPDS